MMSTRWNAVLPLAMLVVSLLPRSVAAQNTGGPMTVQRIGNSAFIAPDFKITEFDGKACGVAGAYGGYLVQNTFFIGAGGYGLTDTSSQRDMWYFGLVTGVYVNRDKPLGFGFKALIGGGEASVTDHYYGYPYYGYPAHYHTGIFVFEPEANLVLHMNQHMTLTGGVGYRITGDPYWGYYGSYGYINSTSGVTGTVSLQIGGGI